MPDQSRHKTQMKDAAGLGSLLLTIFVTELAVMELLSPFLGLLPPMQAALLDAALVVVFAAFPLWFLIVKPLPEETVARGAGHRLVLLAQVLAGIFLVEYLVMLLLPALPDVTGRMLPLVDAAVTATASSIFIWRFLICPQIRERSIQLMDTPLRLYVLLLCTVFLSGLLREIIIPLLPPGGHLAPAKIADALLTTLCGAPLIWFLVVLPLKREAALEKTRVAAVHAQVIERLQMFLLW